MNEASRYLDRQFSDKINYATLSYPFLPLISGLAHEAFPFIAWLHTASLYKNKQRENKQ